MLQLHRRPVEGKPWLTEYAVDNGSAAPAALNWFRAANLYDAARKLLTAGHSGPCLAYAANGTLSMEGTLEDWAKLMVGEPDKGVIRTVPYAPVAVMPR